MNTYTFIAYDIHSNRTRSKVSKYCKKAGLIRIQYSLFTGNIAETDLKSLEQEVRKLLSPTDKFAIVEVRKTDFLNLIRQSNATDIRRLLGIPTFWQL